MRYKILKNQHISKNCLVCGIDNELGLKTCFFETEQGELVAVFKTLQQHQSYPGVTHGGISAAILDEVIGRAIMITTDSETFGVTLELRTRFKKPVPIGLELKAVGRITKHNGRVFEGTGEIYLPSGEIAIEAEGKYMKRRLEQITDKDFTVNEWFLPDEKLPEQITV